jgi:hypothetical protein
MDDHTLLGLPTDQLLAYARRWFSPSIVPENQRILAALEQPVSLHLSEDTPFEDFLSSIGHMTSDAGGEAIPIVVHPAALTGFDSSGTPLIGTIDLDGVPLKTVLITGLEQLGLTYDVRDGKLVIIGPKDGIIPFYKDPFLIGGHCVLALVAAAFGAIVAPLVPGKAVEPVAPGGEGRSDRSSPLES